MKGSNEHWAMITDMAYRVSVSHTTHVLVSTSMFGLEGPEVLKVGGCYRLIPHVGR